MSAARDALTQNHVRGTTLGVLLMHPDEMLQLQWGLHTMMPSLKHCFLLDDGAAASEGGTQFQLVSTAFWGPRRGDRMALRWWMRRERFAAMAAAGWLVAVLSTGKLCATVWTLQMLAFCMHCESGPASPPVSV